MKLGSQTNSVMNHIYSRAVVGQPTPEVGMGATLLLWTDRHAATIVEVQEIKGITYIKVQADTAKVVSGTKQNGSATYEYSPNPNGQELLFRREPNGRWQQVRWNDKTKRWSKRDGEGLRIGERDEHYDPSF